MAVFKESVIKDCKRSVEVIAVLTAKVLLTWWLSFQTKEKTRKRLQLFQDLKQAYQIKQQKIGWPVGLHRSGAPVRPLIETNGDCTTIKGETSCCWQNSHATNCKEQSVQLTRDQPLHRKCKQQPIPVSANASTSIFGVTQCCIQEKHKHKQTTWGTQVSRWKVKHTRPTLCTQPFSSKKKWLPIQWFFLFAAAGLI